MANATIDIKAEVADAIKNLDEVSAKMTEASKAASDLKAKEKALSDETKKAAQATKEQEAQTKLVRQAWLAGATAVERLKRQVDDYEKSASDATKQTSEYREAISKLNAKIADVEKNGSGLARSLKEAGIAAPVQQIEDLKGQLGGLASVATAHPIAAVGVGIAAAGAFAFKAADDFARSTVEIDKQAKAAGLSIETFSRYQTFAKSANLETKDMAEVFAELANKQHDAMEVNSEQAKTFRELGISITDTNGKLKSTDTLFLEVADSVQRMGVGGKTTSAMMRLFGDDLGLKLTPALTNTTTSVSDLLDVNDKLGKSISETSAKTSKEYVDAVDGLGNAFDGLMHKLGEKVLPYLAKVGVAAQKALAPETLKTHQIIQSLDEDIERLQNRAQDATKKGVGVGLFASDAEILSIAKQYEKSIAEVTARRDKLKAELAKELTPVVPINGPATPGNTKTGNTKPENTKTDDGSKAIKARADALRDEKKRQDDVTRAVESFEKAEADATSSSLDGFEKILDGFNRKKDAIEKDRDAALKLAKTDEERVAINLAADEAIESSRQASHAENTKRIEKEVADAKKLADERIQAETEARNQLHGIIESSKDDKLSANESIIDSYRSMFDQIDALEQAGLVSHSDAENARKAVTARVNRDIQRDTVSMYLSIANSAKEATDAILGVVLDSISREMDMRSEAIGEYQSQIDALNDEIEDREGEKIDAIKSMSDAELKSKKEQLEAKKKAEEEAALGAFRVSQGIQALQTVMATALAIIQSLAAPGGAANPINVAASVAAGAVGAASLATIAMQEPPSFHTGGVIMDGPSAYGDAPDEVRIKAKKGETIVTEEGARNLGGTRALLDANAGRLSSNQSSNTYIVYDRRVIERSVYDSMKLGGVARKSIQGLSKTSGHSNRR